MTEARGDAPVDSLTTGHGPEARLRAWQHLAVLAVSFALVCLFTYPLILDPGGLLPKHKDPFMYGWTMVSNVRRLLSAPLAVFHGNTFYPHGNTIAYTDVLLTPALAPAGPIYLLTGNPVLQYNLTLLSWWALSGWAMYALAFALLRSHPGAAIAAAVFTLSPFRTDFYLELQMQLAFPIPLGLLCLLRFLETQRWRHLIGLAALLWVEALASMYYAIILGLAVVVVTALHAILRPGCWSWRLVGRGAVGAAVLGIVLAPFLVPYVQNDRELGLVRELRQPARHSADILTYFETGVTRLYRFRPSGHIAETSLFMGFVALALAATGCVSREPSRDPAPSPRRARLRWALTVGTAAAVAAVAVSLVGGDLLRAAGLRVPRPQRFFDVILLLGLMRIGAEGFWAARDGDHRRPLGEHELRWIWLFVIALFFVLSLGPFIHYGRQEIGRGLYYYLYPVLVPLHAIRVTARLGVMVVLGVGLLAGLGLKRLCARLPGTGVRAAVTGVVALLLLAEYATFPLPYQRVDWRRPPPVYRVLAADPDDVAVLEWPQGWEYWDDYYTFMSINHWKRLVNGASGFSPIGPAMTVNISATLSEPERPQRPFPSPAALRYLLGIHPLRYVVVHNKLLDPREQRKWQKLRESAWARHLGTFGDDDLYRLVQDEAGTRIEKFFSWDYARTRREIAFRVRPLGPAARERWIEVDLNGRLLARHAVDDGWTSVEIPLPRDLYRSAPNTLTVRWRYREPEPAPRRPIGATGVVAPVDLYVASGGFDAGDRASILAPVDEHARNHRGYNVVAMHPTTAAILWADVFDTYASADESRRLADAIGRLPPGTIVAAAVKDEAAQSLTEEAVAALRSVGAARDIRGQYRVSHLVVGVKGAAPGTAIERSGYEPLEVTLGMPRDRFGIEVRDFALR